LNILILPVEPSGSEQQNVKLLLVYGGKEKHMHRLITVIAIVFLMSGQSQAEDSKPTVEELTLQIEIKEFPADEKALFDRSVSVSKDLLAAEEKRKTGNRIAYDEAKAEEKKAKQEVADAAAKPIKNWVGTSFDIAADVKRNVYTVMIQCPLNARGADFRIRARATDEQLMAKLKTLENGDIIRFSGSLQVVPHGAPVFILSEVEVIKKHSDLVGGK
jgi:hypothetical protein